MNVIAFAGSAVTALLALADGDSVALAGELTPKAWIDANGTARPALDLVAHAALTEYHVARKRKVMQQAPASPAGAELFDDPLPDFAPVRGHGR